LKAPRNLNVPVRCNSSGFRKTVPPTRSLRTGKDNNGVRTAKGAMTLAAASISAGVTGSLSVFVIKPFYAHRLDRARCGWAGHAGRHLRQRSDTGLQIGPCDDLEMTVLMLGERRAAFHPVAAVHVADTLHVADHGIMDMAADHAVGAVAPRFGRQRSLERAD